MRKIGNKILLPLLCVVALSVCMLGVLSFTGSTEDISAKKYDANSDGRVTVPEILERDKYLEGVWYPWFTHQYLGCSLGQNPELEKIDQPEGGSDYYANFNNVGIDDYGEDKIKQEIFNLKALGYNMLGFEGSCWGEGCVRNEQTGDVTGVRTEYLNNIRRLLDICREVDMPVMWTMCFHASAVPDLISVDAWYFATQFYCQPEFVENYCEKFVKPVCNVLNEYPDVVAMVCSTVELENETNDSELGNHMGHGDRETYGITQDDCVHFVTRLTETVKEKMPNTYVTIATNTNNYAMYAGCNFDMVGRNQYSSSGNVLDYSNYYATAPVLATEWGLGDENYLSEENAITAFRNWRDNLMSRNYTGWFQWCWQPTLNKNSTPSGNQFTKQNAQTVYDFRQACYEQYYHIEEIRAEAKSAYHTTGNPSMFYHDGTINVNDSSKDNNGKLYWIQPKNVTTYLVQRSVDGGNTWTDVTTSGADIDESTGSHRYYFRDPNPVTSGTVQYRVTVNGKTSYSNVWKY